MSKERLEEIKQYYSKMSALDPGTQEDILWLIEQAERVDELERKNYDLREDLAGRHSTVEELNEKIDKLWIQNKRYRDGLEKALYFVKHSTNEPDKVLIMQEYLEKLLESESE